MIEDNEWPDPCVPDDELEDAVELIEGIPSYSVCSDDGLLDDENDEDDDVALQTVISPLPCIAEAQMLPPQAMYTMRSGGTGVQPSYASAIITDDYFLH